MSLRSAHFSSACFVVTFLRQLSSSLLKVSLFLTSSPVSSFVFVKAFLLSFLTFACMAATVDNGTGVPENLDHEAPQVNQQHVNLANQAQHAQGDAFVDQDLLDQILTDAANNEGAANQNAAAAAPKADTIPAAQLNAILDQALER
jgi:hypothetical protein